MGELLFVGTVLAAVGITILFFKVVFALFDRLDRQGRANRALENEIMQYLGSPRGADMRASLNKIAQVRVE